MSFLIQPIAAKLVVWYTIFNWIKFLKRVFVFIQCVIDIFAGYQILLWLRIFCHILFPVSYCIIQCRCITKTSCYDYKVSCSICNVVCSEPERHWLISLNTELTPFRLSTDDILSALFSNIRDASGFLKLFLLPHHHSLFCFWTVLVWLKPLLFEQW